MAIANTIPATHALVEPGTSFGHQPLKILHIFDHSVPILSGYSIRSLAILREQRRRGWQTAHLTTPRHLEAKTPIEQYGEFSFYRSGPTIGLGREIPYVRELKFISLVALEIERVARAEKPDIIHAHSPALNGAAALLARWRLQVPVVYEVRAFWEDAAVDHGTAKKGGIRYRLTRSVETYVLRHCDAATTICQELRNDIVAREIDAKKVTVIPNAVNIDDFPYPKASSNTALKEALGIGGRTVFGFLGSFYAYEGLDLLLSAVPDLLKEEPDAVVLLVGGGPAEGALREQATRLNLLGNVHFVGSVPHERIQEYYRAIDICVYPRHRTRLTETVTPLKPLEAMALGRVVLASDVGGHRELIRDGETGRLFAADDAAALTNAMVELIRHRDVWVSYGRAARDFVERERTWPASTAAYADVYDRALAAGPRANVGKIVRSATA